MDDNGEKTMQVSAPVFKYEWNLTTVSALIGIVGVIWYASSSYSNLEATVVAMQKDTQVWRAAHMEYHKERLNELSATNARTDERLKDLEASTRRMDSIEYRLTVQETGSVTISGVVAELRQTINDQTGDIRLIREIVQRLENGTPNGRELP